MISKKNRLSEREVKKVLTRWKPFFSYGIVSNFYNNNLPFNRFAIVIWSKSVNSAVSRNYFRRTFYKKVAPFLATGVWKDYVFVVKKQTKLDKKNEKSILLFIKDLDFLLNKI